MPSPSTWARSRLGIAVVLTTYGIVLLGVVSFNIWYFAYHTKPSRPNEMLKHVETPPEPEAKPEPLPDWAFGPEEANRRQKEAEAQLPLADGWSKETVEVAAATPHAERKLNVTYYTNSMGMRLVCIPPGQFVMGTIHFPKGMTGEFIGRETPAHEVRLTKPVFMGACEVTNAQFKHFHSEHQSGSYRNHRLDGPNQPVVRVSYREAEEFCEWLSRREEVAYRLPTEAEWEYACRAGSSQLYPWGDGFDGILCNHADASCANRRTERSIFNDRFSVSAPVGQYSPNAFGLYDMLGNVYEYCWDWYGSYGAEPQTDPRIVSSPTDAVVRGGSWQSRPVHVRSGFRATASVDGQELSTGFRVVAVWSPDGK